MIRQLPGTIIETDLARPDAASHMLTPLFLAGGLTLSQVAHLTDLEPHVIQNWVKRGFLSPPRGRRYTRRQFCRIALINMLKDCLRLDKITLLLASFNGALDDESDDLIDDAQLYLYVTALIARTELTPMAGPIQWKTWCGEALRDYDAPTADAASRVALGLQIILTVSASSRLKLAADLLMRGLEQTGERSSAP